MAVFATTKRRRLLQACRCLEAVREWSDGLADIERHEHTTAMQLRSSPLSVNSVIASNHDQQQGDDDKHNQKRRSKRRRAQQAKQRRRRRQVALSFVPVVMLFLWLSVAVMIHSSIDDSNRRSWLPLPIIRKSEPKPGISEREVLMRLENLLRLRWNESQSRDIRASRKLTTTADHTQQMSPALLHALQSYNRLHSYTDDTNQTRAENRVHGHLRSAALNSAYQCWTPVANATACEQNTYTILAPIKLDHRYHTHTNNTHLDPMTRQLRQIFLHTLQWLYDPVATSIYLLILDETDDSEEALRVDLVYGARLRAWHSNAEHPIHLVYASNLSTALQQVKKSHQHQQNTMMVWRSVLQPLPDPLTRSHMQTALQLWKPRSSAVLVYNNNNNNWNGVVHHSDYLCFLARHDWWFVSMPDWPCDAVLLALVHLSPVPWQIYGRNDGVVDFIGKQDAVWGGVPPLIDTNATTNARCQP